MDHGSGKTARRIFCFHLVQSPKSEAYHLGDMLLPKFTMLTYVIGKTIQTENGGGIVTHCFAFKKQLRIACF